MLIDSKICDLDWYWLPSITIEPCHFSTTVKLIKVQPNLAHWHNLMKRVEGIPQLNTQWRSVLLSVYNVIHKPLQNVELLFAFKSIHIIIRFFLFCVVSISQAQNERSHRKGYRLQWSITQQKSWEPKQSTFTYPNTRFFTRLGRSHNNNTIPRFTWTHLKLIP